VFFKGLHFGVCCLITDDYSIFQNNNPSSQGDLVTQWKARLPPAKIIRSEYDGRTLAALLKRARRAQKREDTKADGNSLMDYWKQLTKLTHIEASNVMASSEKDYKDGVEAAQALSLEPSTSVQLGIWRRVAGKMVLSPAATAWTMLKIFDPEPGKFNMDAPVLAELSCGMPQKLSDYKAFVYKKVLVPAIMRGTSGFDLVKDWVNFFRTEFPKVDVLELDHQPAAAHTDGLFCSNGINFLFNEGIDIEGAVFLLLYSVVRMVVMFLR